MSWPAHRVLERPVWRPQFGMACADDGLGLRIERGLVLRVARVAGGAGGPQRPAQTPQAGPRGVFALHGVAAPDGSAVVRVHDTEGRYLPLRTTTAWPLPPAPALNGAPCVAGDLPLFLAPAHHAGPGRAEVRAALWNREADAPAAWALLELHEPGSGRLLGRGLADAQGQVLVALVPGEPLDEGGGTSPPAPQPMARAGWALDLVVRCARSLPLHADPGFAGDATALPDLCELLAQPVAAAFTAGPPAVPFTRAVLRHGEPLILAAGHGGRVLVDPA